MGFDNFPQNMFSWPQGRLVAGGNTALKALEGFLSFWQADSYIFWFCWTSRKIYAFKTSLFMAKNRNLTVKGPDATPNTRRLTTSAKWSWSSGKCLPIGLFACAEYVYLALLCQIVGHHIVGTTNNTRLTMRCLIWLQNGSWGVRMVREERESGGRLFCLGCGRKAC